MICKLLIFVCISHDVHFTSTLDRLSPQRFSMNADVDSLPEPTEIQRQKGWQRDYTAVWAEHADVMKQIVAEKRTKALNNFQTEQHVVSGTKMTIYDFTGGVHVTRAKNMARRDEFAHEEERLKEWKRVNQSP